MKKIKIAGAALLNLLIGFASVMPTVILYSSAVNMKQDGSYSNPEGEPLQFFGALGLIIYFIALLFAEYGIAKMMKLKKRQALLLEALTLAAGAAIGAAFFMAKWL